MKLKDINKATIKIRRGEQKQIPVNEEIKQALKEECGDGEKYAETIDRVLKTNEQKTELLVTLVESFEDTPSKMTEILSSIPENLRELFGAIINERKERKRK